MAKVEYIAAGLCCAQILWMKQTLSDFELSLEHVPKIGRASCRERV